MKTIWAFYEYFKTIKWCGLDWKHVQQYLHVWSAICKASCRKQHPSANRNGEMPSDGVSFPKILKSWSINTEIGQLCWCISPFPSCFVSLMLSFSSNPAPLPYPLFISFLFSVPPLSFPCFLCTPRFAGPSGSAPAVGHCRAGALPQPHSQLHPRLYYCCGGLWHHQWVRASLIGSAGIYASRAQLAHYTSCFLVMAVHLRMVAWEQLYIFIYFIQNK